MPRKRFRLPDFAFTFQREKQPEHKKIQGSKAPKWEIDFYPVRVLRRVVDLPIRIPNPSPTLDKNLASMGPGILSSIGVGVWRKAPEAFPDSNTTLDTFQSATKKRWIQAWGPW